MDAVHYHAGNTNPADPFGTDEECLYALTQNHNNPLLAAAALLETKAAQFVMRPTSVRRGDRTTTYGADMAQAFLVTARQLRLNASIATTAAYAGGQSLGEKQANRRDRDLPQPFARVDLHTSRPWPSAEAEERDP